MNRYMNRAALELRAWRTERGHKQAALAKLIGASQCMVAYLETGARVPGRYLAKQIASVCGVAESAWAESVDTPPPEKAAPERDRGGNGRFTRGEGGSGAEPSAEAPDLSGLLAGALAAVAQQNGGEP